MYSERYELSTERIALIAKEKRAIAPFDDYFSKVAQFIGLLTETYETVQSGKLRTMSQSELADLNYKLYEDILPKNYDTCYGNPTYMNKVVTEAGYEEGYAKCLCFLYAQIRALIPYIFEQEIDIPVIHMELFIEIYDLFTYEEGSLPPVASLMKSIYWFESDNCDIIVPKKLREQLDPTCDFAYKIVTEADLNDKRYLYYYGEYVSENELGLSELFSEMPQEEIDRLADVYTEGYRLGFVNSDKDLSKKETVDVRFPLGMERMVLKAVSNFEKLGLKCTMRRAGTLCLNRRGIYQIGFVSTSPNKQYFFDHLEDEALFYDKDFVNRRVGVLKASFEEMKWEANHHAGPACIEVFGEKPFDPISKKEALALDKKQQKLAVDYADQSGRLTNEYIIGEERSFTIISFPVPEIGENFKEVFADTVKVNTLDYMLYQKMQQILIDTLDRAKRVHIVGKGVNHTDLTVALYDLKDPKKETIFENCVADVNIPVGEVFTSPKLKGTNGVLHVSKVYLYGLQYKDLEIAFKDGVISDYTCKNFDKEEDNRKYIKDNILNHHDFLPLGEFAIGTNTTAYKMAIDYQIQDRLDILIGEKTGPHFAVGDTCYNYDEDLITYNPDGKQIVARENDFSAKRKENPKEAYFHCHTDITIPYDELAGITAIDENGGETPIIVDGLFVLPGLEELNKPLLELWNK